MKNSSLLIKLANSEAGRYVLGIKNDFPIVKISPNSWHYRIGKNKFKGVFHCYNVIEKCLSPYLVYKSLAKKIWRLGLIEKEKLAAVCLLVKQQTKFYLSLRSNLDGILHFVCDDTSYQIAMSPDVKSGSSR